MVWDQARKHGIRTEAGELREIVAQLAFWDYEKAKFEKFEQTMESTRNDTPRDIPLDAEVQRHPQEGISNLVSMGKPEQLRVSLETEYEQIIDSAVNAALITVGDENRQSRRPSQRQSELGELVKPCILRNEGEATSPGGTQTGTTRAFTLVDATTRLSAEHTELLQHVEVSDTKLQMLTGLSLSRGFGGATLSQMIGIGTDEELVQQQVSLSPESSMLDEWPEFAPQETTWETLDIMPLD